MRNEKDYTKSYYAMCEVALVLALVLGTVLVIAAQMVWNS